MSKKAILTAKNVSAKYRTIHRKRSSSQLCMRLKYQKKSSSASSKLARIAAKRNKCKI